MTNECEIYEKDGIIQQPVYSGSRNALSFIVLPWKCSGEECFGTLLYPIYLPISLIDLFCSAVADTLVLPYTYNLQYKVCPNVNFSSLAEKRELLSKRIQLYYADPTNPEQVWKLSSRRFKGKMSKNEFIKYLHQKNIILKHSDCEFITEIMIIRKDEAEVHMQCDSKRYVIYPWTDYWVFEQDDWYILKLSRKTEYDLLLKKKVTQP